MFEEDKYMNEFDRMVKSILDEGREEVPAGVWEAVSEGLDKAARGKTVVLWWRRAAAGVAVAAAVAIAVIFNIRPEADLVPEAGDSGLIAVVEPETAAEEDITLIPDAVAELTQDRHPAVRSIIPQTASEAMDAEMMEQEGEEDVIIPQDAAPVEEVPSIDKTKEEKTGKEAPAEYFPEDWGEDTPKTRNISFTLSGLASTNQTQSRNRIGPMKAPSITSAPKETGISETSTNSTYGLPVSFGAGVKIGLSPRWSVGVGANYTLLARQFYGKYIKVDDNGSIEKATSSDIRNTQHFIGIPVNAYFDIVNQDRINLYAYAGGTVEKCVSDNYNVLSTAIQHREKTKGVQLSANAGIGVEFMLGKHLGLYIDPSVRYYFDCDQPKSIRTEQPLMFGFEMGFRARL